MPSRICQTCKHFEPGPTQQRGWCRNPALYAPQQSQVVAQDTLDCARHHGDFWEAAVDADDGTAPEREPLTNRRRLRLFQAPPQLIPAPAGAFASFGGGDDDDDGEPRRPGRFGVRPGTASAAGGLNVNRTGLPQGQERTVSYQPEERYWTDYLRIALPIVGLLLMLALFWFWARSIIGDDNGSRPTPTSTAAQVMTATSVPPTATTKPEVAANPVTPSPTLGPDNGPQSTNAAGGEPTESATQAPDETPPGKGFRKGDTATVNDDDVYLRSEASPDSEPLGTLANGDEVEIASEAVKQGDYYWVEVNVQSGALEGQTGYVADQFLDPSQ